MTRWRRAAIVTAVALALIGCGSDDGGDESATTGETGLIDPTSTEAGPATSPDDSDPTASESPGSTAPTRPTAFTDLAADAVNELRAAWEAGDEARARAIAPGDVVEALFAVPADGFEVYGCDTGEFETSTCNFRNRATGVFIVVSAQRQPEGWQIATILVNAD